MVNRLTADQEVVVESRGLPKLGVWAWSFVGVAAATIIAVLALAAVSEIVLPLTFAAVLAVIFKPLVGTFRRHKFSIMQTEPHRSKR